VARRDTFLRRGKLGWDKADGLRYFQACSKVAKYWQAAGNNLKYGDLKHGRTLPTLKSWQRAKVKLSLANCECKRPPRMRSSKNTPTRSVSEECLADASGWYLGPSLALRARGSIGVSSPEARGHPSRSLLLRPENARGDVIARCGGILHQRDFFPFPAGRQLGRPEVRPLDRGVGLNLGNVPDVFVAVHVPEP